MKLTSLYLATPANTLEPCFADSMGATLRMLKNEGVKSCGPDYQQGGWTALARNASCAEFEAHAAKPSHILMIDSDIQWDPKEVRRLLVHGEEVDFVGCTYPKKALEWERVKELSPEERGDPEAVRRAVSRQVWEHQEIGARIPCGWAGDRVEVDMLPTGFMLMSRDGLEDFRARYELAAQEQGALLYFEAKKVMERRSQFFRYQTDKRRVMLGEDAWFSAAARGLGLRLYKLCDAELGHVGKVLF